MLLVYNNLTRARKITINNNTASHEQKKIYISKFAQVKRQTGANKGEKSI